MRAKFSILLLMLAACGGTTSGASKGPAPVPAVAAGSPEAAIAAGQTPATPPQSEMDRPLPVDARVRLGKLPNGLTYYVLPHKKPEKRAQFWLAVNAGSVLEDDDQRASPTSSSTWLQRHQALPQAGAGQLPRGYWRQVRSRSQRVHVVRRDRVHAAGPHRQARARGEDLPVLRDWAGTSPSIPTEVDKERGVVLEEWRLGRGAGMRIFDKQAPKSLLRLASTPIASPSASPRSSPRRRAIGGSLLQGLVPPRPDGGDRRR
jgi:hypothetical protein